MQTAQNDLASTRQLLASLEAHRKATTLSASGGLLDFTRFFFWEREGLHFEQGPHHKIIADVLDDVLRGKRHRVLITLPPRYTKTELAVVNFIAKGFQINPGARFIHTSGSDPLARENSDKIRSLMMLEEYQELSEARIRFDRKAIDRWITEQGGGVLAKASGGTITGFGAGTMDRGKFTGALIVDDPLKPDDAFYPTERQRTNRRATNTLRSRLAHERVPIIVIMQRLHDDDFAGHLLRGGTGDIWDHLDLPIIIDQAAEYPRDWTHGRPIAHDLPDGPLWPEKHSLSEIEILKADQFTFNSQYMQRPVSIEGALFNMDGFKFYRDPPAMEYFEIWADTAQKTEDRHDWSVFQLWGKADTSLYLIDQMRGKWEAPDLEANAIAFWRRHRALKPRAFNVEDKVSGTGLIQSLRRKGIPIMGIKRDRDKYSRGMSAAPYVNAGFVHLPAEADFINTLLTELQTFDGLGSSHDDQVDPMMDAIENMLGNNADEFFVI